jgi:hypothetical protein
MKKTLPHLPHIAKAIRPTVAETVKALHKLDQGIPLFSYRTVMNMAHPLYSGKISLDAAVATCARIKDAQGAKSNEEVARILHADAQKASYMCHPLKDRLFHIRHDLAIPVRPRLFFVKDGLVHIFWLQPWKLFDLTEEQHGIIASVIKNTFVVDDFENARLYMLDTSAPDKASERQPEVYGFDDLPILSYGQLKDVFDRFAAAYDIFIANRRPKPARHQEAVVSLQGELL